MQRRHPQAFFFPNILRFAGRCSWSTYCRAPQSRPPPPRGARDIRPTRTRCPGRAPARRKRKCPMFEARAMMGTLGFPTLKAALLSSTGACATGHRCMFVPERGPGILSGCWPRIRQMMRDLVNVGPIRPRVARIRPHLGRFPADSARFRPGAASINVGPALAAFDGLQRRRHWPENCPSNGDRFGGCTGFARLRDGLSSFVLARGIPDSTRWSPDAHPCHGSDRPAQRDRRPTIRRCSTATTSRRRSGPPPRASARLGRDFLRSSPGGGGVPSPMAAGPGWVSHLATALRLAP